MCDVEHDGDGIAGQVEEVRTDPFVGAEKISDAALGGHGPVAATRRLVGIERCRESAPVTVEAMIAGSRCSNLQEVASG